MTKKPRTSTLLAQLKTLADSAASNLYERIKLASAVLNDIEWIANTHDGDDLKAQDALQTQYFCDLGGFVSLGKLRLMFDRVPEAEWMELRCDVAAVEVVYEELVSGDQPSREPVQRTSWKKTAEQQADQIESLQSNSQHLEDLTRRQAEELAALHETVNELNRENQRLLGRIEELTKLAVGRPVAEAV